MQKELNPDLFGDTGRSQGRVVPGSAAPSQVEQSYITEVDRRIVELRGQIQGVVDQLNRFGKQVQEALQGQHKSLQAVQKDVLRLEGQMDQVSNNSSQSQSRNQLQLIEGRQIEHKVSQMLERHQTVLRNFEVRVNQLQRIIKEKDEQLMIMRSQLIESKSELARLKRL